MGFVDKANQIEWREENSNRDSTWESLVDTLYQMMDAQALGNWLTLEIITTGNELVWLKAKRA